jgi:hypothetical protein
MIVRYLLAWLLKLVPELKWSNERLIRKKSSDLTVTARSLWLDSMHVITDLHNRELPRQADEPGLRLAPACVYVCSISVVRSRPIRGHASHY